MSVSFGVGEYAPHAACLQMAAVTRITSAACEEMEEVTKAFRYTYPGSFGLCPHK